MREVEAGDERGGQGRGGGVRGTMAGRRCGWGCVQPVPEIGRAHV